MSREPRDVGGLVMSRDDWRSEMKELMSMEWIQLYHQLLNQYWQQTGWDCFRLKSRILGGKHELHKNFVEKNKQILVKDCINVITLRNIVTQHWTFHLDTYITAILYSQ